MILERAPVSRERVAHENETALLAFTLAPEVRTIVFHPIEHANHAFAGPVLRARRIRCRILRDPIRLGIGSARQHQHKGAKNRERSGHRVSDGSRGAIQKGAYHEPTPNRFRNAPNCRTPRLCFRSKLTALDMPSAPAMTESTTREHQRIAPNSPGLGLKLRTSNPSRCANVNRLPWRSRNALITVGSLFALTRLA